MNIYKFSTSVFVMVLALSLGMASCKKETITPDTPVTNPTPGTAGNPLYSGVTISTSIGGEVLDESNNPVANALVTVGSDQTYTNTNGHFYLTNISVDSDRAYVKVEKDGYFLGARAVNPEASTTSYVSIQLIQKIVAGTVDNSTGGIVSLSTGPSLTFEAGDISKEDGSPYNGQVTVYASYLDPTASNIGEIIPGDLDAIDENGDAVALITYGMVAVELFGSNGENLNITPGQTAELSMPVQAAQLSAAPSSIPLWYFDEAVGNWIEEGSATLQGSEYIGTVSHFTFWNCDQATPAVNLELSVSCNNVPNANVMVRLSSPQGLVYGTSYTNANGEINELMPAGVPLILEIYDICGNVAYTQNIGTNNSDLNLGQITQCNNTVAITGTLVDCNGAPVSNGMFHVQAGVASIPLFTDANGYINTTVATCSSSNIVVSGFDFNASLQSSPVTVAVTATIDLGTVPVCNQIDEFISYNYDGVQYDIYDTGQDEVYANTSFSGPPGGTGAFGVMSNNGANNISFFTDDTGLGTYPNIPVPGLPSGIGLQVNGVQADPNTISVTYTLFGSAPGDYYEGTFSGNYSDTSGNPHVLSGSFRIK